MPSQLVYTSAPRGLVSGQSGFCVVARNADLREALSQRLERISSYRHLEVTTAHLSSATAGANLNPTICAYRVLDLRGAKFHVLTRIQPTGLDFTARTNHLAHHLAFVPEELPRLPAPAAILRYWDGWLGAWQGEPRILEPLGVDAFSRIPAPAWPAMSWKRLTGDGGRAAGLFEPEFARGCYLSSPGGEDELLALFCEALQLSNADGKSPLRPWQYTFTNFLQAEDAIAEFQWRGCRLSSPAAELATRRGVTLTEVTSIRVPDNPLAKLAREGPATAETNLKGRVTLRRDDSPTKPALRPDWTDFEPITDSSAHRARRPVGVYLTINTNVLRILAVALVLVLLVLGLLKHFRVFPFESAATIPVPPTNSLSTTKPAPSRQSSAPPVTSPAPENIVSPEPSPASLPPTAEQQSDALNRLPEIPTYIIASPSFEPNVSLSLDAVEPLRPILDAMNKYDLKPADLDLRFSYNVWDFPLRYHVRVQSRPSEHKVVAGMQSAAGDFNAQVTFDYSGRADSAGSLVPVRASVVSAQPTRALSLLFTPTNASAANFKPFRILFVNTASPPGPISVRKDALNLEAQTLQDVLSPLKTRLAWFQSVQWQLRPLVSSSSGDCQDLYAGWPSDEQPRPGEELDLTAATRRLQAKRENFTRQVTGLVSNIAELKEAIQPKLDAKLQLGAWLKLDNDPKLKSFAEFRNNQPLASGSLAALLPEYLDQVKKKAEPQHAWVREWPVLRGKTDNFQIIQGLCLKNIEPKPHTLQSNSNYFLTLWRNLGLEDQQNELERKQTALESELARLNQQLDRIPATLSDVPCFSLCLPGYENRPVEMIRFR